MPTPRHPSLLSDFDVFFHYSLVVVFFFFLTHWAQRLLGEQSRLTIWVVAVHEEAHDMHCYYLLHAMQPRYGVVVHEVAHSFAKSNDVHDYWSNPSDSG